jgi:hypothetical protein
MHRRFPDSWLAAASRRQNHTACSEGAFMAIAEQQDCGGRDYTLQGSRGQRVDLRHLRSMGRALRRMPILSGRLIDPD